MGVVGQTRANRFPVVNVPPAIEYVPLRFVQVAVRQVTVPVPVPPVADEIALATPPHPVQEPVTSMFTTVAFPLASIVAGHTDPVDTLLQPAPNAPATDQRYGGWYPCENPKPPLPFIGAVPRASNTNPVVVFDAPQ